MDGTSYDLIPCHEKLPSFAEKNGMGEMKSVRVILYTQHHDVYNIGHLRQTITNKISWILQNGNEVNTNNISHWCHLPTIK